MNILYNTIDNRLKLLAGLIDTDGSLARQTYEISQKNENLSNCKMVCKKRLW